MKKHIILIICLLAGYTSIAQSKPAQKWLDQKFSMFIHFGLYAEYGGVYNGKKVEWGYSEQIQSFAGIFSDWYAQTAEKFNPTKWNADSIVALAKQAGMKSIVFTSKHHDGFCMFHSQYTDFNIVDATPYGKDIMKELSEACQRGGIDFAVYFSLIDWHFPQAYPISSHNADLITDAHHQYNLKQVKEILTGYGNISEMWFDMGSLSEQQSQELYDLVESLQPNCMVSGRLGNDVVDFCVMADNDYPNYSLSVPWQTAASMFNETWGYRSWQKRGKVSPKVEEKILSLVKVVSRGGNYLLNIGPRGNGSVVEFEKNVLLDMGKWLAKYGEAIYATHRNPFFEFPEWGEITTNQNELFLFVKKELQGKEITLPPCNGNIEKVVHLENGKPCAFSQKGNRITVPQSNDPAFTVLKVYFKSGFSVVPPFVKNNRLTQDNAICKYAFSSKDYYCGYKSLTAYNWYFQSSKSNLKPTFYYTESEIGKRLQITIDSEKRDVTLNNHDFTIEKQEEKSLTLGKVFKKSGRGTFGYLAEETGDIYPVATDKEWKEVTDFKYNKILNEKINSKGGVQILQEIFSQKAQSIAVEIGGDEAVYILLNGKYITAHFPQQQKFEKQLVLLPLKKGDNQLIIKHYSRYNTQVCHSLYFPKSWKIYYLKMDNLTLSRQQIHELSVNKIQPKTKVEPLRMNNLKIQL